MKAKSAKDAIALTQIPNVGPRLADDFRLLGISKPKQLQGKDPIELYNRLNKITGARHDPCVLDTFMAAVDFMNGAKPKPWWKYTPLRKKLKSK